MIVPPQPLSHYRLDRKIGEGGMGIVYRATDLELQRMVAIKLMSQASLASRGRDAFLREARVAAALNHPNICTVHEVGQVRDHDSVVLDSGTRVPPGTPYLVMELLEGTTLAHRLEEQHRFRLEEVLEIAVQVSEALAEAHDHGIVHRDLKPHNVMMTTSGRVKIVDFGLAKAVAVWNVSGDPGEEATITQPGGVLGTPAYMSPEQISGQEIDARSDVFSFGTMLYEMLSGRHPFAAASLPLLLMRIVEAEPETPARPGEEIPEELRRIIRRCLEKRPDRRYYDTRDLVNSIQDLRASLQQPVGTTSPISEDAMTRDSGPTQVALAGWSSRQSIPGLKRESFSQILRYVLGQQEEGGAWPGHGDHWSEVKTACVLKALAVLGFEAGDSWCVGEGSSRITSQPARALDFLADKLSAVEPPGEFVGEDIWDTCQVLLALAAFGRTRDGARYANHINLHWEALYRAACDGVPANRWAGPAYLAAMYDVVMSYGSVLESASRIGDIIGTLTTLEHMEDGKPAGCFRAANSADPNMHRWNTGLVLRSLGSHSAAGSDLVERVCEWVLGELAEADQWLGATDRESPMYLGRFLAGLLAVAPVVGEALQERISSALEQGNAALDGYWSPDDVQRTGDLKAYTAVLEYLAAWKFTAPAGLILGASSAR